MAATAPLCMFCGSRPRWYDSATGQMFDYCGNTCKNQAKGMPPVNAYNGPPAPTAYPPSGAPYPPPGGPYPPPPQGLGGYNAGPPMGGYGYPTNPYPTPPYYPQQSGFYPPSFYPPPTQAPPPQTYGPVCAVPTCSKPAWLDPNGNYSLFCGRTCRDNNPQLQPSPPIPQPAFQNVQGGTAGTSGLGTRACVICKMRPYDQTRSSLFCSTTCLQTSETMAPGIIEIPSDHPKFKDVANQFDSKWTHTNVAPKTAQHIYLILMSSAQTASYNAYRDLVERQGGFASNGRTPGNENRRFHGTTRECLLGDPGNTQLCSNTTCGLCGIIRTSFDLKFYKGKTGWGRFGCGLYTSATSSKSDSYTTNKTPSSYKAMLLNKVVVGNGYKLTSNSTTLTGPPAGYHSVLGEPDTAGALNYDEVVVYDNDAIRPAYLVVY